MTLDKRGKNSWRIRETIDGKRICITIKQDHKPTRKEISLIMAEEYKKDHNAETCDALLTFRQACDRYNDLKEPMLSPSTIKDYRNMCRTFSEGFQEAHIRLLTSSMVQAELNKYYKAHSPSPKTMKNRYGYIVTVCKQFNSEFTPFRIELPKKNVEDPYIPTKEEIKILREEAKGTEYDIAIQLACLGLRRSELIAVTSDDIEDGILHIRKSMVQDKTKAWVVKDYGKTSESKRDIPIPQELADLIEEKGKACDFHPGNLLRFITRVQKKHGMDHFSFHKIRHWCCSELHHKGIPEADILRYMGWSKRSDVMKLIYRHDMVSKNNDIAMKMTAIILD